MTTRSSPAQTNQRAELRTDLRERRRQLPAAIRIAAAQDLAANLLALPFAPASGFVAGYWAMDGEIALHAWQLALPAAVTYCLPVLHTGRCLRFAPWRAGGPLKANRYGIPEPDINADRLLVAADMTMVVLPLVGFDTSGNRLGMGAGWYDRSFAFRQEAAPPPWLVGAAFARQQVDALDAAPWDVGLDATCTDAGTHLTLGVPVE